MLREEISKGLELIEQNTTRLWQSANKLDDREDAQAKRLLVALAEEEAAKYLMLLDAVRCPKSSLGKHLDKFYKHLARGIYVKACEWRPADFAEVKKLVERERPGLYLDGPNDVDYIFRNQIAEQREGTIYVDYVESENRRYWTTPPLSDLVFATDLESTAIGLVQALNALGVAHPDALAHVAKVWDLVSIEEKMLWQTLAEKNAHALDPLRATPGLAPELQSAHDWVVARWPYPM